MSSLVENLFFFVCLSEQQASTLISGFEMEDGLPNLTIPQLVDWCHNQKELIDAFFLQPLVEKSDIYRLLNYRFNSVIYLHQNVGRLVIIIKSFHN